MTDIKFEPDYGYREPSPVWAVISDNVGIEIRCSSKEDAIKKAAELAVSEACEVFHVMASIAQVSTKIEVIGKNFDPTKKVYPNFDDAVLMPAPEAPKSDEVL